jgi:CubicO group peptidase (beta-lactamase class C family)
MRRKFILWIMLVAVLTLSAGALNAQDIAGDWQGTLKEMGRDFRIVLHVAKGEKAGWSGLIYYIDDSPEGSPVTSLTLKGADFRFAIDSDHVVYEGKLSPDGNKIVGAWTEGKDSPRTLELDRATKDTAWQLPDPNWGHKIVKVDPNIYEGYAGRYQLTPSITATVIHEGEHLFVQINGQPRYEMYPASSNTFFLRVARAEITFNTDSHGGADGLVLHQNGRDLPGKKINAPTPAEIAARCQAVDALVGAEFAKHAVGSVTVGVVSGKELIWTKSYGNADMEKKLPADKDTIYRIGSITKMFTALMLEQLVDAGKVHLSDPVEKYFPEMKTVPSDFPGAPPITLIQLANHTSGMDREPADMEKYVQGPVSDWEKTLVTALAHTRFSIEPGTQFSYSNIGFATLGAALGRAAGEPYTEYVPKHIFAPLGMTHTTLNYSPDMQSHLSKGYDVEGDGKIEFETPLREQKTGRGYKVPNGAIYTTVGDMAHFASFLLGHGPESVLKTAVLEKNLTNTAVEADFSLSTGYTLGGQLDRRDGYVAFGHGGGVAGYQAGFEMNRDLSVAVIVFANVIGSGIGTGDLANKALDILSKVKE